MEDWIDMDMSPQGPTTIFFGCEPKADKNYPFKVDNGENEHRSSLRMISLGLVQQTKCMLLKQMQWIPEAVQLKQHRQLWKRL